EFGMQDVQQAINRVLDTLKDFARENLSKLTQNYLEDVVNREYSNVGMTEIAKTSEDTIHSVLDRIDESILSKENKDHLFNVINDARASKFADEHSKIISHYFLKLLRLQESLKQNERNISEFCELCSEYIIDKRFIYDSVGFSFTILAKT